MPVTWEGVTLTLEAAFSASTGTYGAWNVATWDTETWGPDIVWTDISAYLRSFSTRIGRSREVDHYQAGTATFVLSNRDGRFSPDNLSGPYVSGGITGVRPWRPIRLRATYGGVTYPVFFGRIESITDEFPAMRDAVTVIRAVDGIALLAAFDGYEQASQGSGEMAGVRIQRVLNNAGWIDGRIIESSGTPLQATTLAQNAWTEILLAADSDGGAVWVDPDGSLVFETNGALFYNTRSNTVQATFDESTGVRYSDVAVAYDGDLLVNVAKIARANGTEQTAADNTSRALYGEHVYTRSDLICTSDSQALSIAAQLIATRSSPELRIQSFAINPKRDPATLWPQALGRRIRDRIELSVEVPSTAVTITRQCFIDGIEHQVSPSNWVTTFRTSSASAYAAAVTFGLWNSGVWNTSTFGW